MSPTIKLSMSDLVAICPFEIVVDCHVFLLLLHKDKYLYTTFKYFTNFLKYFPGYYKTLIFYELHRTIPTSQNKSR